MIDQVKEDSRTNRWGGLVCILFRLGMALVVYQSGLIADLSQDVLLVFSFLPLVFLFGAWLFFSSFRAPSVRIHVTNADLVVQPDERSAEPVRFELAHLTNITASNLVRNGLTKLTFYAGGQDICITLGGLTHEIEDIIALISRRLRFRSMTLIKKPRTMVSGYYESWDVVDLG